MERSIVELLKVALDNINTLKTGLCNHINTLFDLNHITFREYLILIGYIDNNEPADVEYNTFWWPKGEIQPRKEWLENQIKLLENTSNHDN